MALPFVIKCLHRNNGGDNGSYRTGDIRIEAEVYHTVSVGGKLHHQHYKGSYRSFTVGNNDEVFILFHAVDTVIYSIFNRAPNGVRGYFLYLFPKVGSCGSAKAEIHYQFRRNAISRIGASNGYEIIVGRDIDTAKGRIQLPTAVAVLRIQAKAIGALRTKRVPEIRRLLTSLSVSSPLSIPLVTSCTLMSWEGPLVYSH